MKGLVTDIKTGDLLVEHGSATVIESEEQVVENILLASRGEFKELPLVGAEARQQLGGERDVMWPVRTKKMIAACGVEIRKISIKDNNIIAVE